MDSLRAPKFKLDFPVLATESLLRKCKDIFSSSESTLWTELHRNTSCI